MSHAEHGGAVDGTTNSIPKAWAAKVGKLTVGQFQALAAAVVAVKELNEGLDAEGFVAVTGAVAEALVAITGHSREEVDGLPLDLFIDTAFAVAEAVLQANADYLSGPVSDALRRITGLMEAASSVVPVNASSNAQQ